LRKPLPVDPASFGERFRAVRVSHGYTQADMAQKFGVSFSTVKFWEQGRTEPIPTVRFQVEAFLKGKALTTRYCAGANCAQGVNGLAVSSPACEQLAVALEC
jgi:transcriptional regulator with XRE-family HTH domain